MKAWTVFIAVVLLVVVSSCSQDEAEVTREIEVTRVVTETVVETVVVEKETAIFDVEAEKETLESLVKAWSDADVNGDCAARNGMEDEEFKWFIGNFAWQGIVVKDDIICPSGATNITINGIEWMIAPELAVARSLQTWALADGSAGDYLLTTVWKKSDGQWAAIHGHASQYEP